MFNFQPAHFPRLILLISLICCSLFIVIFIPPDNWFIKSTLIASLGLITMIFTGFFQQGKFSLLIAFFVVSNLVLLISKLTDPLNFVLLIILFIGLYTLLR